MKADDRATLENIIINEKANPEWLGWDSIDRAKWCNYRLSKNKSEELLAGFDVFIWATTLLDVDPVAAIKLLRYACETMPCFLDSGFEDHFEQNNFLLPYIDRTVQVREWHGFNLVEEWNGKELINYRGR